MNQHATAVAPTPHACFVGPHCTWGGAGHALTAHQALSLETSGWADAVIETVSSGGWISVVTVHEAARLLAWNHAAVRAGFAPGTPVAISLEHRVLAVGGLRLSLLLV